MNVEKIIHPRYRDWLKANEIQPNFLQKPFFGEFQYIYSSDKGKISLVELPDYFRDGETLWETYCLEGNLFEDIDRFGTKEEAEVKIKELLD